MSDDSHALHVIAASLGALWKRSKKKLPTSTKAKFAALLFDIREHVLPKEELSAEQNLDAARPDIRIITKFLERLATRGGVSASSNTEATVGRSRGARDRWCDIEVDESEVHHVHADTQTDSSLGDTGRRRVGEQETQTDPDMTGVTVLVGQFQLLEAVGQAACHAVLLDVIRAGGELHALHTPHSADDYLPLVDFASDDDEEEEEEDLCIQLSEIRAAVSGVGAEIHDLVSGVSNRFESLHEALAMIPLTSTCAEGGQRWDEARSGPLTLLTHCAADDGLHELEAIRARIANIISHMADSASYVLPGVTNCEHSVSVGPRCRLVKGPDPRELRLIFDPMLINDRFADARERAEMIKAAPPAYLLEMPWDECDDVDIVLNEALHRPTNAAGFLRVLMEVQGTAGGSADHLAQELGLSVSWDDLKRSVISRALRKDGDFTLAEVICEASLQVNENQSEVASAAPQPREE